MIDINDLRIGSKVKVVDKWNSSCGQNCEGLMDKYLGQVVTVLEISRDTIRIEEDEGDCPFHQSGRWSWNAHCFEYILDDMCGEDFDISSKSEILSFILS